MRIYSFNEGGVSTWKKRHKSLDSEMTYGFVVKACGSLQELTSSVWNVSAKVLAGPQANYMIP